MGFSFFELLFLICTLAVVYIIRPGLRTAVLALACILYCCKFNVVVPITILICTVLVYLGGLLMKTFEKNKSVKSAVLFLFVLLSVVSLCFFKLFAQPINRGNVEWTKFVLEWLFMSIGFSYYVFQAISYLADVYKGRIEPEYNPLNLFLYLAFFPKLISGPIERAETFLPQLEKLKTLKIWDLSRYSKVVSYMLYGFFLKTLLADRIGPLVAKVFENPGNCNSPALIVASFLYTIQIYLDFAGYSAVAIGVAKLFDINLSLNFLAPYFSTGFAEFWRRWHITLGSWLRDYIYIPLGGNRKGKARKAFNTMIVFLVCGIWHGGSLNFVVWGLIHGIFTALDGLLRGKVFLKKIPVPLKWLTTFLIVSFAWIFFGSEDMQTAVLYIRTALTAGQSGISIGNLFEELEISTWDIWIFITGFLLVVWTDVLSFRKNKAVPELLSEMKYGWRLLIFYLLIMILLIFGVYGPNYDPSNFIYMRF